MHCNLGYPRGRCGTVGTRLCPARELSSDQRGVTVATLAMFNLTAFGGDYGRGGSLCSLVYALGIAMIWLVPAIERARPG